MMQWTRSQRFATIVHVYFLLCICQPFFCCKGASLSDVSTVYVVENGTAVFPWNLTLDPGETINRIEWGQEAGGKLIDFLELDGSGIQTQYISRASTNGSAFLILTNITDADVGTYRCTVRIVDSIIRQEDEAQLELAIPSLSGPEIIGYDPSSPPQAGDNNPLQCQITGGNPLPTLRWARDGVAIPDSQIQTSTSGSTVTSQLTGTLQSGDNGKEFVCIEVHVAAPEPPRSDSETLNVYFPPNSPSVNYTGAAVTTGDSFTATCQTSTGNPTPTLTWYLSGSDTPVGTPGTGISQLVIDPLTKDNNEQVYVCRATNAATGDNPPSLNITLLVHYPLEAIVIQPENTVEVVEGNSATLTCVASGGNPTAVTYTWTKQGNQVPGASAGELNLNNSNRQDTGNYTCIADNGVPNDISATHEVIVQYLDLPSLTPSSSITVHEGESVTALCTVNSVPPAMLKWTKEGSDEEKPNGNLMISKTNRTQAGNYFCVATNAINSTQKMLQLIVIYKPDLTITPLIPVNETDSLTLTCTADSNPDVTTMSWTHVTSGRDIPGTVEGNVLTSTIQEVTYEDRGNYSCIATNSIGSSDMELNIIVNFVPKFTHTKSKYAMDLRQNVTMECSAIAHPTPITFSWSMNGTEITTGVTTREGVSIITIVGIQATDYGNYTCTATNSHGGNSAVIQFVAETAPEPSENLDYTSKTAAGLVTLTWTAGINGGLETNHTVQYRLNGTTDWGNGPLVVEAASQNRPEFTRSVEISEKEQYEIRIRAQNSQGAVESNVIQVLVEGNQILYGTLAITSVEYNKGVCEGELSNRIVTQLDSVFDMYKGYEGALVTACRSGSILADFEATVAKSESAEAKATYITSIATGQLGEFEVDARHSRISDNPTNGGNVTTTTIIIIIAVVCGVAVAVILIVVCVFVCRNSGTKNGQSEGGKDVELEDRNPHGIAQHHDVKDDLEGLSSTSRSDKPPLNATNTDESEDAAAITEDSYQSLRISHRRKSDHTYQGLMTRSENEISNKADVEDTKTPSQFPRNQLDIKEKLGEGEFGSVHRAEASNISEHEGITVVAVKTMKAVTSPAALSAFFKELSVLKIVGTHPNVVSFLGCCTDADPFYLLLEYVSGGSLQSNLRTSRTQQTYGNLHGGSKSLSSRDLTKFAWDVAKGMSFLSSKKILHRDLATRNVLVSADRTCKVPDFGFSREGDEYERTTKARLPIRWMAPESLFHRKYTTKSDVWAFGVLLWEIVTLGATPYPGMSKRKVMDGVQQGYRMEKPKHCDDRIYSLMKECWKEQAADRPDFPRLERDLDALMEDDHEYTDLSDFNEAAYASLQTSNEEKF